MSHDHDEMRDLIAVVALGAGTPDEEAAAEAHARTCPKCARELEELRRTAGGLATAVPTREPSAALKERIMETVRAEAAERARPEPPPARGAARRRRWWDQPARRAAVAFAAVTVVVGSFGVWSLRDTTPTRPDVTATIAGSPTMPDVRGTVTFRPSDATAAVRLRGLPPLKKGDSYQLWLIHPGGKPVSVADLQPAGGDVREATISGVREGDAVAVTAQPATERSTPQGPLLAQGVLPERAG